MKQDLIIVIFGITFLYSVWYTCTNALHPDIKPHFDKLKRYDKIHALTTTIINSDKVKEFIGLMKTKFSDFQATVRLRKQSPDTCLCNFDRVLLAAIEGNWSQWRPPQNIPNEVSAGCLPGQLLT